MIVTGTIINVAAIVTGGIVGRLLTKDLSHKKQTYLKTFLGFFVLYVGITTTWKAINGSFSQAALQVAIMFLALIIGNLIGRGLKLQQGMNKLGKMAQDAFQRADTADARKFSEGLVTCTLLFCVGPMAFIGALQDGLSGNYRLLAVKAVMDGLATLAFVKTLGWGPVFAAIPVLAYQGTVTLAASGLQPYFTNTALLDSINAVGGLLIICISTMIWDVAKPRLADYLPSLAVAPLLTWLLR
ncbi:MAG TPA: DUF554 domain-containing protein [Methylomirabilota bacterium]|nr:DUF554 domain-containing protein [Methylomirabilota bacterium]